ncbi:flagellar export protein FliJ [Vibrio cincinnatiensis]|jgi:flagellar FliJ protein|uniref:Flagellar FliJ protein n=1 Tax=Vibrio cincinnatiensis DSM 19608 TaxID=1123491 RepID=A0A1T4MFH8_VIBCI|nr:flagellar export protein FliJ [Vibrio cincinnatiensis]MCG3721563.1 flagella biosynthesis chaperone FliJ [Vibrio cincinnatiensis]MCG3725398.1 flagella biosynthesis chaperone FliJ [Vibrio cincinnatiensis]MCG3732452.1 flagella biosynthesis chaperone FliJ [Vibrio cincinnatiensis]MCG3736559.1 flagella biosynthesis chaperone FliJ [Vibrio cincinnatiensis]MCG3738507.1 flagella biosynthesis chaperone FliJ [Vibrio cincinnatiensis]
MDNALEFLLGQAKESEDKAVLALSKARNELEGYYQQLKQIEQYRLEYCQQLVQRGQAGLTASQYGHLNRFLTQLDETLAKQRSAEQHFTQQVENCQQHWMSVRKQRRSYEWLIEKKRSERERLQARREQKQMDEFSTLSFNRQRLRSSSR